MYTNDWCRHPRPNRPFGHCLIPAIYCPVTVDIFWCLVLKTKRDIVGGEKRESLGWNSEWPRKTSSVMLDDRQRVAQQSCTNCEGESESGPHLGGDPGLSPNSTRIQLNSTLGNLQKSESFGRKINKDSADQDWIQIAGPKSFDKMHSCIVSQSFRYHSNVVLLSFRCRFVPRDMTKFLRWNDPKAKISLVAGSFHFRTRRNDTRSSFEGTTGTHSERPTVFGEGAPNG